jgi:hypothetical protein
VGRKVIIQKTRTATATHKMRSKTAVRRSNREI